MISVCIITKNESENLKKCLSLIKPHGVEIVVVDTGSTDNTLEVAHRFTSSVYNFDWCNDFSAARNYAIKKAAHDNIVFLDTDEFITEVSMKELEALMEKNPLKVGRIHRKNFYTSMGNEMSANELINRCFNKQYFKYSGKIHEQIVSIDEPDLSYETYIVPIHIDHTGYIGSMPDKEKKAHRNITLLKEMLMESPTDTYILYQIGKAYFFIEDYKNASAYFSKILSLPFDTKYEYVTDMIISYGYSLINSGNMTAALDLEKYMNTYSENADYLFMMGFVYMQNTLFDKAVNSFIAATEKPISAVNGTNSFLAYYNAGVIYECLGYKEDAKKLYSKCGSYDKALLGLERCK